MQINAYFRVLFRLSDLVVGIIGLVQIRQNNSGKKKCSITIETKVCSSHVPHVGKELRLNLEGAKIVQVGIKPGSLVAACWNEKKGLGWIEPDDRPNLKDLIDSLE